MAGKAQKFSGKLDHEYAANKAFHQSAIPLRSIAAGELDHCKVMVVVV